MKILYSTIASLLLVCTSLYSMEGQFDYYDMAADAAESERPASSKFHKKAPVGITMERTAKESRSQEDSETLERDFFSMPTTNGSDEYDQGDSVTSNADLVSKIEEHKVKDKSRKKKKSASKRIIELFEKDEETIKKLTNENNPFENISEKQKKRLLDHYSNRATIEELRKVFFHVKERLSKLRTKDKKDSFEYMLCTTIYKTVKVVHCKGNKIEAKAFLYAAGYESDEEEIIQKGLMTQIFADEVDEEKELVMTSFIGDGEPFYRMSKKLLTTDLPGLAVQLAAREKAIKHNLLKKEQLEKELAEVSDTLKKDNSEKGYITRSIGIIEKNRTLQKADLLDHETFLQRKVKTLIGEIDALDEEAILGKANNSAQKKVFEEQLATSKLELTNLQKNLKNFDTPTKTFGIW